MTVSQSETWVWDGASVAIDPSMDDWIPDCHVCHKPINAWGDAVLVATSTIGPYDEADGIAAIHRRCPDA